jgi:2',3'-cyclic-nucleotide 2'-phosphodiesterase (5'-nucleotidase family)
MRLTLLHLNDLHGRLGQLPRLFTLIQRARAEARPVLLLDGGDSSSPGRWESNVTQGRANYALLEAMGVQASVAGNNEIGRWGRDAFARLVASAHFPILAANLRDAADPARPGVSGLGASLLVAFGDFRIGLVGATAPQSFYPGLGLTALPPLPVLRQEIAGLREQGARTIVMLSHLGVLADHHAALAVSEIDVIVGGHTHTAIRTPVRARNAVIAQAGSHGKCLGRVDLELDDTTGRVRTFSGMLVRCDESVPPDPTISATLEFVREEAARLRDAGK